jgi:hypothetical protein
MVRNVIEKCMLVVVLVMMGFCNDTINIQAATVANENLTSNDNAAFIDGASDNMDQNIHFDNDLKTVQPYKKGVRILKELSNLRTRNSKTFMNADNTLTMVSTPYSQHFFKDNKWVDINTNLKAIKYDKQNAIYADQNNFHVKLSKNIDHPLTIDQDKYLVEYIPQNTNKVEGIINESTMEYQNAWNDTDIMYTLKNDSLKMNLVLKDSDAPKNFVFEVKEKNLEFRKNDDGSIDFVNDQGVQIFHIPRMWVTDATSQSPQFDKLNMNIEKRGDKAFINIALDDSNLTYPIVIDPTTTVQGSDYDGQFGGTNLLFINTPDVNVADITNVRIDSDAISYQGIPDYAYVTRQEYGSGGNLCNCRPPAPETRGFNVVRIGTINTDISGDTVRSAWGSNTGTVFGGAVYSGPGTVHSATVYITYNVPLPPRDAVIVSDNIPVTMEAGKSYPISITVQNSGALTWSEAQGFRLGGVGDSDPFASARQFITGGQEVASGQQYAFNFTMVAPSGVGTYVTDWEMLQEGAAWFGGILTKSVTVIPPSDTTAPSAPTNLKITSSTSNSIGLSWGASEDNTGVVEYDIYNGASLLASVSGGATECTVSNLTPNMLYNIAVKGKDDSGNMSLSSNIVSIFLGNLTYTYDSNGRLLTIIITSTGQVLKSFNYDNNGNMIVNGVQ